VIVALIVKTFIIDDSLDIFKKLKYHSPCKNIIRIEEYGVEDFAYDPKSSVAFLSMFSKRREFEFTDGKGEANINYNGKIGLFDFKNPTVIQPLEIVGMDKNEEFRPHGIGLYRETNGSILLFVVSHKDSCDAIVIFRYINGKLYYEESITHPLFSSINDVAPVNTRSFYVTLDYYFPRQWKIARLVEKLFRLPISSIIYYDRNSLSGETIARNVESGFQFANGINSQGDFIYVADSGSKSVSIYKRTQFFGAGGLELVEKIFTGTFVDNIEFDKEGNMYIGSHPKSIDFLRHALDKTNKAPSHVIKITKDKHKIEEIYLGDGNEISGSSVAVIDNNILIIGSVFDVFLVCFLK